MRLIKLFKLFKGYTIIDVEYVNDNKTKITIKDDRGFIIEFDAVIDNLTTYLEKL